MSCYSQEARKASHQQAYTAKATDKNSIDCLQQRA